MVMWIASSAPAALVSVVSLAAMTLTGHGGSHPLEWGDGPLTVDSLPRVTYVAHRGGAREVPENSMSGLMAAYRRGTAQVLDFDTRVLRDGTPVVFHDATLNRTTFLGGEVRKLDAEEWKGVRLRPRDRLPGSWRSERPPTVEEVLDRLGGRILLMLELKDPAGLERVAGMIRARGLTRSVFVNTNDPRVAGRAPQLGRPSCGARPSRCAPTGRSGGVPSWTCWTSTSARGTRMCGGRCGRGSRGCGRTPSSPRPSATAPWRSAATASSRTRRGGWHGTGRGCRGRSAR
jgi:hypothetical protein